jgi:hypothetical protein
MNYLFYLLPLIFGVLLIKKDFRITSGYKSQKYIHIFSILFVFLTNVTAFRNLFAVVRNFNTFAEWSIYAKIEYLPIEIGMFISFVSSLLNVLLYVIAFGMLARGDFSRKLLIWVIPINTVLSFPIIAYMYRNNYSSLEQIVSFWVTISIFLVYIGLFFLYRSEFMKSFFNAKKKIPTVTD